MKFDLIETKRKPVYDVLRCLARDTDKSSTIDGVLLFSIHPDYKDNQPYDSLIF